MQGNEELIRQLTESLNECAQNAGKQAGWTAELTVLIVAVLVVGGVLLVVWLVRQQQKSSDDTREQLKDLKDWRNNVVADQLQSTVKALDASAASESNFRKKLEENTEAVDRNTLAVHGLSEAIARAPCGRNNNPATEGG